MTTSDPEQHSKPVMTGQMFSKSLSVDFKTTISSQFNYSYARIVELDDGTFVVTGEELNNNFNGIPIYRSTNGGRSFVKNSDNVHDPKRDSRYNAQWQPHLYVLKQNVGSTLKKEDILLVATTINNSGTRSMTQTVLNLYVSKDKGITWDFMSEISRSSVNTIASENGLWEGNLIANDNGILICFYADETDHQNHSQRIVYRHTNDGITWSDVVEVVALENPNMRPGMPSCTRIKNGEYFLALEMVGEPNVPIYFKKSDDCLNWGNINDAGTKITVQEQIKDAASGNEMKTVVTLQSSPYAAWTPVGKDDRGTIFVTSMKSAYSGAQPADVSLIDLYVSYDSGATWSRVDHPIPYYKEINRPAYSNSITFSRDGKKILVVNSIQPFEDSRTNYMILATVDIQNSLQDNSEIK